MHVDEPTLIARAQRDPRAFGPLYDRYVERIYAYAQRELQNTALPQDIVSTTFEKALKNLPHSEGADGVPSWSPDGQRLIFAASTPDLYDDGHHIHVINLSGDKAVSLTDGESDNHTLVWAPDGRTIAFTDFVFDPEDPTNSDTIIYTIPVTETHATPVLTRSVSFWGLDW